MDRTSRLVLNDWYNEYGKEHKYSKFLVDVDLIIT